MSVKAAVLRAPGAAVEITHVRAGAPHAGEVEVRIAAAGVCHSDLHVVRGEWEVPHAGRARATRAPAWSSNSAKA